MTNATVTTVPVPPPTSIEAKEPSRVVGGVTAVVSAVFFGLSSYGITYDSHLPSLIVGLVIALITFFAFIIPIIQGEIVRGKVWSAASVARIAGAIVQDAPPVIAAGEAVAKDVTPAESTPVLTPAVPDGAPVQP